MSIPTEPLPADPRRIHRAGSLPGIAVYALALLWLLLPAIQYLGAVQRSMPADERMGPLAPLAALDLTPWYGVLLGATLICCGLRCYRQWQNATPPEAR